MILYFLISLLLIVEKKNTEVTILRQVQKRKKGLIVAQTQLKELISMEKNGQNTQWFHSLIPNVKVQLIILPPFFNLNE